MNLKFSKNINIIETEIVFVTVLYYLDRPEANQKN